MTEVVYQRKIYEYTGELVIIRREHGDAARGLETTPYRDVSQFRYLYYQFTYL